LVSGGGEGKSIFSFIVREKGEEAFGKGGKAL